MARDRVNRGSRASCEPICVECGGRGKLVSGKVAMPDKPQRAAQLFYLCRCGGLVGCHAGTALALGRPASARTRYWRFRAHEAFDAMWLRPGASRRTHSRAKAYRWLARQLDMPEDDCHIGRFDQAMCERVISCCTPAALKAA